MNETEVKKITVRLEGEPLKALEDLLRMKDPLIGKNPSEIVRNALIFFRRVPYTPDLILLAEKGLYVKTHDSVTNVNIPRVVMERAIYDVAHGRFTRVDEAIKYYLIKGSKKDYAQRRLDDYS